MKNTVIKSDLISKKDSEDLKEFRDMLDGDIVVLYTDEFIRYRDKKIGCSYNIPYSMFRKWIENSDKTQIQIEGLLK